MKVIDLLNKIANGEAPKKIKYKDEIYIYREQDGNKIYQLKNVNVVLTLQCFEDLLNEVEILDEDKIIYKYNTGLDNGRWTESSINEGLSKGMTLKDFVIFMGEEQTLIKEKLYELIDEVNKLI